MSADDVRFEECSATGSTDKALLVYIPDLGRAIWFPHSHISGDSEVYTRGDTGALVVSRWIAEQKGIAP